MTKNKLERIDSIRLADVEPRIFAVDSDERRESQVWRRELALERGGLYCVNAASGTGKTSLCSFIMGVRTDYTGRISFDGDDISRYTIDKWCELRRCHLAYLPQELDVFDELSALDNVLLKNSLTDHHSESEIRQMFERLEIDNRIDTPAGRMSVGQKQRMALIRALCQPFDFILLYEPVSHLDQHNNSRCGEMVAEAAEALDAGVIFTSVGAQMIVNKPFIPLNL